MGVGCLKGNSTSSFTTDKRNNKKETWYRKIPYTMK